MTAEDGEEKAMESAAVPADSEVPATSTQLASEKKEPEGVADSAPERPSKKEAARVTPAVDPPEEIKNSTKNEDEKKSETATDATMDSTEIKPEDTVAAEAKKETVVPPSKKSRPPYKFDPDKITLRFLFANRDGLAVTVDCKPTDTVGEVKGALISVWPEDMPNCDSGDALRMVCMGKGYLTPDTRTLEDCQIPVFKTHPTPVNVSVKPSEKTRPGDVDHVKKKGGGSSDAAANSGARSGSSSSPSNNVTETGQGCGCVII